MTSKPLTEKERQLFKQFVGDTKPITADKYHLQPGRKTKPAPKSDFKQCEEPDILPQDLAGLTLSTHDSFSYIAPGLQKNVLKKLRKGYFSIEATLDLHGLTSREAKQHFSGFLLSCSDRYLRCVHIIHGKGYRSFNNTPVLKNKLNIWLRHHPAVLAFCSSNPADGGTGAVYVLLKG